MFYFVFAQIVQIRLPVSILRQIVGDMLRQENVASIAAVHDALGYVNSRPGNIERVVNVSNLIDRPAVNSHSQTNIGILS